MNEKNDVIEIIETPKGPMDSAPKVEVVVNGVVFSEARRERGWLIAEVPTSDGDLAEIRGKTAPDLRTRVKAALREADEELTASV